MPSLTDLTRISRGTERERIQCTSERPGNPRTLSDATLIDDSMDSWQHRTTGKRKTLN